MKFDEFNQRVNQIAFQTGKKHGEINGYPSLVMVLFPKERMRKLYLESVNYVLMQSGESLPPELDNMSKVQFRRYVDKIVWGISFNMLQAFEKKLYKTQGAMN